jgi:hypothetical protein
VGARINPKAMVEIWIDGLLGRSLAPQCGGVSAGWVKRSADPPECHGAPARCVFAPLGASYAPSEMLGSGLARPGIPDRLA